MGAGAGVGYNLNVPWVEDALGDANYAAAFALVVEPALAAFAPDLVLVSAGFDAAEGIAGQDARDAGGVCGDDGAAAAHARAPLALALRGRSGYNLEATAACAVAVVRALAGDAIPEAAAARAGSGGERRRRSGGEGDARAGGALARAVGEPARGRRLLRRGGRAAKGIG